MELDYKAIGKRIKIARIKADLTQERLAELIDISPTHLSNIETGTTRVSLNTIISIANALSVTGDDLLCDNIIMSKVQFEKDIALLLEDCDEYEIRIIKDKIPDLLFACKVLLNTGQVSHGILPLRKRKFVFLHSAQV